MAQTMEIRKVARRRRRRTCCSRSAQLCRRHFTLLPSTPSDVEHKSCEGVKTAFETCLFFLIYFIVEDIFGKSARTLLLLRSRGHRLSEQFANVDANSMRLELVKGRNSIRCDVPSRHVFEKRTLRRYGNVLSLGEVIEDGAPELRLCHRHRSRRGCSGLVVQEMLLIV